MQIPRFLVFAILSLIASAPASSFVTDAPVRGSFVDETKPPVSAPIAGAYAVSPMRPGNPPNAAAAAALDSGWQGFLAAAGANWSVQWNADTQTPGIAFGKPVSIAGFGKLGKENVESACRSFVQANRSLFKIDASSLKIAASGRDGGRWRVSFQQHYNGVPVFGGNVKMSFTKDDRLVMFGSAVFPGVSTDTSPSLDGRQAVDIAVNDAGKSAKFGRLGDPELCILPIRLVTGYDYLLCWRVQIAKPEAQQKLEYLIDAHTWTVLRKWDALWYEITGTASGDYKPEFASDATQVGPLADEMVTAEAPGFAAASTYTSPSGAYSLTAPTDPCAVNAKLKGLYCVVTPGNGIASVFEQQGVGPNDTVNVVWNSTRYARIVEPSAYWHMNLVREYYSLLDPGFTGLDYAMPVRVSLAGYNNAYWDGLGITLGQGDGVYYGDFGLYSDVIYHEYTHGVTDKIYSGVYFPYAMESGALNEGWSDYFGCRLSVSQNPLLGDGGLLIGQPSGFRNLVNNYRRESDWVNEVHGDSQMFSGSLWEARQTLGTTMDELVHFARYDHPASFEETLAAIIVEDDTRYGDADPSNGSPHAQTIFTAFGNHGMGGLQCLPGNIRIDDSSGNANGRIDPGETVSVAVTLTNSWANAADVSAALTCTDPYVQVQKGNAAFPSASYGSTVNNDSDMFVISVASNCPETRTIYFSLQINASGPYAYSRTCLLYQSVAVGQMAYDDDGSDLNMNYGLASGGMAVRFTPDSYPCYLSAIRLKMIGGGTVPVKIWDDDAPGGVPGTLLGTVNASIAQSGQWMDVDIRSLDLEIDDGSFYAGWIEAQDNRPFANGMDFDPPYAGRSWIFNGYYWYTVELSGWLANNMVRVRWSNTPIAPGPITNFVAFPGSRQVGLSWTNPTEPDFAGARVMCKTTGYLTGPTDGTLVYSGTGTGCVHGGLTNGTPYYYAAFAFDGAPNYSPAALASATPHFQPDWLNETFDGHNDGDLGGQGDWTTVGGISGQVQSAYARGGTGKAALLDTVAQGASVGNLIGFTFKTGGYCYFSFDVAQDAAGTTGQLLGYVSVYGSDSPTEIARVHIQKGRLFAEYGSGTLAVLTTSVANLSWYNVKIGFNIDTKKMDFWLDGSPRGTNYAWKGTATNVSRVIISSDRNTNLTPQKAYIDNVRFEPKLTISSVTDDGAWSPSLDKLHFGFAPVAGAGEYQYAIGTTSGGTQIRGWTSCGASTDYTATGLSLTQTTTTYYISGRCAMYANFGPTTTANGIKVAPGIATIPAAKELADGTSGTIKALRGKLVSAAFPGYFYIQEPPIGYSGIKVISPATVSPGDEVDVAGFMGGSGSERFIDCTGNGVIKTTPGPGGPYPVVLTNASVGGAALNANSPGVMAGIGPNNIGLLVCAIGRVAEIEPVTPPDAPTWFTIDDGSGVNVKCLVPSGVTIDAAWQYVAVTGISSCENVGAELHRLLRVRSQEDIKPLLATP
ncbi:MAG: M36 family metallopeptidase [Armatimonadota bacterium]|nr:M36 family metallopeptidase [Armatimonadota bacterium]